jgi:hypothetical protein
MNQIADIARFFAAVQGIFELLGGLLNEVAIEFGPIETKGHGWTELQLPCK